MRHPLKNSAALLAVVYSASALAADAGRYQYNPHIDSDTQSLLKLHARSAHEAFSAVSAAESHGITLEALTKPPRSHHLKTGLYARAAAAELERSRENINRYRLTRDVLLARGELNPAATGLRPTGASASQNSALREADELFAGTTRERILTASRRFSSRLNDHKTAQELYAPGARIIQTRYQSAVRSSKALVERLSRMRSGYVKPPRARVSSVTATARRLLQEYISAKAKKPLMGAMALTGGAGLLGLASQDASVSVHSGRVSFLKESNEKVGSASTRLSTSTSVSGN